MLVACNIRCSRKEKQKKSIVFVGFFLSVSNAVTWFRITNAVVPGKTRASGPTARNRQDPIAQFSWIAFGVFLVFKFFMHRRFKRDVCVNVTVFREKSVYIFYFPINLFKNPCMNIDFIRLIIVRPGKHAKHLCEILCQPVERHTRQFQSIHKTFHDLVVRSSPPRIYIYLTRLRSIVDVAWKNHEPVKAITFFKYTIKHCSLKSTDYFYETNEHQFA